MPSPALGLGYTVATSLCLRARRFSTMEPAARPAGLGSDLASSTRPGLGTTQPATRALASPIPKRRRSRSQGHPPNSLVRPHGKGSPDLRQHRLSPLPDAQGSYRGHSDVLGERALRCFGMCVVNRRNARGGLCHVAREASSMPNDVSLTCNDVSVKRADMISRLEHVSFVVGFRCLGLGSSIRVYGGDGLPLVQVHQRAQSMIVLVTFPSVFTLNGLLAHI